jgi:GLPGLI family protein
MNKIIVLLFCFSTQIFWAQESANSLILNLTYDHAFKVFEKDTIMRRDTMQLSIDGTRTSFMVISQYKLDSIYSKTRRKAPSIVEENQLVINMQKSKNPYRIYTEGMSAIYRRPLGPHSDFLYEEQLELDWKLDSGSKNVLGYACKKARLDYGGRTWTAWYAPDLPYNAGPYKFKGLPGLILEMDDDTASYQFIAIAMEQKGGFTYDPVEPIENKEVLFELSREDFNKQHQAFDQLSLVEQVSFGSEGRVTITSDGKDARRIRRFNIRSEEKRVYIELIEE